MDELNADAREILSEMRQADAPRPGARERVRRQLALSVGGALSASALGTVSASAAAASTASTAAAVSSVATAGTAAASVSVAKLALLVVVGAVGGSAVLTPVALLSEPTPRAVHSADPTWTEQTQTAPSAPKRVPSPALASLPSEPASARPMPVAAPALPANRSAAPVSEVNSLGSETRLLARARELLRAGRAEEALGVLREHARSYPDGSLREEALASQVLVLCAQGRVKEAAVERARFHATFPRSPLGPRVDRECGSP
ncbi:MAG: hypothetical protein ACOY0T_16440 [Myxococcota bacterium]